MTTGLQGKVKGRFHDVQGRSGGDSISKLLGSPRRIAGRCQGISGHKTDDVCDVHADLSGCDEKDAALALNDTSSPWQ